MGLALVCELAVLCTAPAAAATGASPQAHTLAFPPGAHETAVRDQVNGRFDVDHRLRAGAGQSLRVRVRSPHAGLQFNVIAPGGDGNVAMFADGSADRPYAGVLPIAGTYTVRVYLVRAAARRGEWARYTLDVALEGAPKRPLPAREDARLPGTPFHARTDVPCRPAYSAAQRCTASVVRYDRAGSASVVLRWPQGRRTVLFDKGRPTASDTTQPMIAERRGEVTLLRFGDDEERFEVPDLLLTGG